MKNHDGQDPTLSSPVIFTTSNSGVITQRAITTPLSITVPNGASLGTTNGQASRIWVGLFDNAGTPVLGVYNSLSGLNVVPWDETSTETTTNISAGSTAPQTWYTAGALTTKPFRIIGFVESIQPTAGAWTASPTPKLFGPGQKKPGDIVQTQFANFATNTSTSGSTYINTVVTMSLTLQFQSSVWEVHAEGTLSNSWNTSSSITASIRMTRAGTQVGLPIDYNTNAGALDFSLSASVPASVTAWDLANTLSTTSYTVQVASLNANGSVGFPNNRGMMTAKEIYI